MKNILFESNSYQVLYDRTSEIDKQIVDKILEIFKENKCSSTESVFNNEKLQLSAIECFSDFADMLKLSFKEKN